MNVYVRACREGVGECEKVTLTFISIRSTTSVVLVMALAFAFDVLVMPFDLLGSDAD